MGYYRGDHYRGDYYRGDPGFFSFIGGALKGLVSGIGKVASFVPGPIGIAGKALTVHLPSSRPMEAVPRPSPCNTRAE